jgi:hypothetical protein
MWLPSINWRKLALMRANREEDGEGTAGSFGCSQLNAALKFTARNGAGNVRRYRIPE